VIYVAHIIGCVAMCIQRPPLPEVERYSLTDEQLFAALDGEHPAMGRVLEVREKQGTEAAKKALADHFRRRTEPRWFVSQHDRPQHATRPDGVNTTAADRAMQHVYRGFAFGDDIDWLGNPTYAPEYEFDKEWSMGFLRMPWWEELSKAYWSTGDEKYAAEVARQFLDFRTKHPIPVKRSAWSSHPLKYTVPEWRTLEIAIRLRGSWVNSFYRCVPSASFGDQVVCEFLKAFIEMARHLEQFSHLGERTSNWTTAETLALFTAGMLFPEFAEGPEWKQAGTERMWDQLRKQVYPDGVQWELAPGYGAGVLSQFRTMHELARLNGEAMPDEYVARLEGMYHYYLYSSVAGRYAAFGDSGHGDARSVLRKGVQDFPERGDFRWLATSGTEGDEPTELVSAFPYAGQYVMRSGWAAEDRFMIVDAGPYGIAHQHEDNLSFELFAYGDYLITDPGSYRYNYDSPWRKFMVSSLAHNTVVVDHQGQNRRIRRALYATKQPLPHRLEASSGLVVFRGTYDSGYGPGAALKVAHTRTVLFVRGRYWVVIDRLVPEDTGEHLYEALFMLNAPAAAADGNVIRTRRDGPNLLIASAPRDGGTVGVTVGQDEPIKRGWKRGGQTVEPNPAAVAACRASGPAVLATLLYPAEAAAPDVRIEFVDADPLGVVNVKVAVSDGTEDVLVDDVRDAPAKP
jgi:hypothetical protein